MCHTDLSSASEVSSAGRPPQLGPQRDVQGFGSGPSEDQPGKSTPLACLPQPTPQVLSVPRTLLPHGLGTKLTDVSPCGTYRPHLHY